MHGRRRVDRRVEIVTERGSQRLFVAFVHETWSITGGHRLRVSSDNILERVFASVSRRCTRFSASADAVRAVSSSARATLCAASAATAAASASVSAACAPSTAAASGALSALCNVVEFALDGLDLGRKLRDAVALLARSVFVTIALRGQVGKRGGQIAENLFGSG